MIGISKVFQIRKRLIRGFISFATYGISLCYEWRGESLYKPEALTFLGATTATKTAPASATHPAIVSEV